MNIIKFLESISSESLLKSTGSRRDSFSQFGEIGKKMAFASVPFGLAAVALAPQKSSAATFMSAAADTPTSALKLALTLEYLEEEFYQRAMDASGLITGTDRQIFGKILQHESDHVDFLVAGLGPDSFDRPQFDFSAGGAFTDTFTNYQTFLALAQAFEDTGVRAYKGQAGNLMSKPELLQAALQIHSVEARHASQVRRLRNLKGWIPGNDQGGHPAAADAVYAGEENVTQAGFNTSTVLNIPAIAGSESFDEPITGAQATTIASLFIVQ
jgi:hypothetical protein